MAEYVIPPISALSVSVPEGTSAFFWTLTGDATSGLTLAVPHIAWRGSDMGGFVELKIVGTEVRQLPVGDILWSIANASGRPEPQGDEWKSDTIDGGPERIVAWYLSKSKTELNAMMLPWVRDKLAPALAKVWTETLKVLGLNLGAAADPGAKYSNIEGVLNGLTGLLTATVKDGAVVVSVRP